MGLQLNWTKYFDCGQGQFEPTLEQITNEFNKDRPLLVAIDTETTGLNIIKDKPFLFIVAWKVPGANVNEGKSFVIQWDRNKVASILKLFASCRFIVGANLKYDLHMLANGGAPFPFEILKPGQCELTDVRILRRLTLPTDAPINESILALKKMSVLLLKDDTLNEEETIIKQFKVEQKKINDMALKRNLLTHSITPKQVKDIVNDPKQGVETLSPMIKFIYETWNGVWGEPNYSQIYVRHKLEMNKYAAQDGILTVELFLVLFQKYLAWKNKVPNLENIFIQENQLIEVYYRQERVGFKVDLDYLVKCKTNVINYVNRLQKRLNDLLGAYLTVGQHKELIKVLTLRYDVPESFFEQKDKKTHKVKLTLDKVVLRKLLKYPNENVQEIANLIISLRRGEKWLSTYIERTYREVLENGDGRFHPLSDQCGTISGRISGDFQQNPKDPLLDENGNELFHPRKLFIPSGDGYKSFVLQDYDQMELRVQADYTILLNCLDVNMCKIFTPVGCVYKGTNIKFDFNNQDILSKWNDKDENGDSMWIDPLTNQPWVPIDPHGLHVKTAFGIDENNPHWKHLRSAGKTINFAVNYGSGLKNLLENPMLEDYDDEVITKIYNSYKSNFKGVGQYQQQVNSFISSRGYAVNRYGRVYSVDDTRNAYKCANYLIQGSCADLVKCCLVKINNLLKERNAKSRVLYSIHDEIIWELYEGEEHLISEIENILNTTANWCKIPLTCGIDLAFTNWAEKKDISKWDVIKGELK